MFQYADLDDLEADTILMCKNAQAYNEETSLIHEDSIVLERVFANARAKVEAELESQPEQPDNGELAAGSGRGGEVSWRCAVSSTPLLSVL